MSRLRLATRTSPLALAQANFVGSLLSEKGHEVSLVPVTTSGDMNDAAPLWQIGGQGVFTVEVQRAVLRGDADVAVHSAKDLPSVTPDGILLACVPDRRDPADVLVGRSLAGLGPGATVATGSPRRRSLLLERRPDLTIVELRGNMATRIAKAGRDGVDAVVAAAAALERLGLTNHVAERLDPSWFVPQVGQGALALEASEMDVDTLEALHSIDNHEWSTCVRAERAFLRELGVGCSVPVGAYATLRGSLIELSGIMASLDGSTVLRATLQGENAESLGTQLAVALRDEMGGSELSGWR